MRQNQLKNTKHYYYFFNISILQNNTYSTENDVTIHNYIRIRNIV